MNKTKQQPGKPGCATVLAPLVAATVGWITYSRFGVQHDLWLPYALDAQRDTLTSDETGMISFYHDTQAKGRPLVLIHSINAAGCAYEMRPLFEHYRAQRPVYALELPGFGFSERSDRVYTPALYQQAILLFLQEAIGQPADVIALSLSCEFAAFAAQEQPDLFHSLTMISPSGLTAGRAARSSQQASDSGTSNFFYRLLSVPWWAQAFYDLVATRRSIVFFLGQSFEGDVDEGLVNYGYLTSHQPGARYAPLYFVSGLLFTRDICETAYEKLTIPVLVLYDRDNFVRFDELPGVVGRHANWQAVRIQPTLGLPHFEQLEDTAQALDNFWAGL